MAMESTVGDKSSSMEISSWQKETLGVMNLQIASCLNSQKRVSESTFSMVERRLTGRGACIEFDPIRSKFSSLVLGTDSIQPIVSERNQTVGTIFYSFYY